MEVTIDSIRSKRIRNDRRSLLKLSAVILLGIFILVGMRAYCAFVQHANNELIKENAFIQAEIDSLNAQISEKTKVTAIEGLAVSEYGMVFPSSENVINLGTAVKTDESLAATIRSEAYN